MVNAEEEWERWRGFLTDRWRGFHDIFLTERGRPNASESMKHASPHAANPSRDDATNDTTGGSLLAVLAGFLGGLLAPKGVSLIYICNGLTVSRCMCWSAVLRWTCGVFGWALPPERPAILARTETLT